MRDAGIATKVCVVESADARPLPRPKRSRPKERLARRAKESKLRRRARHCRDPRIAARPLAGFLVFRFDGFATWDFRVFGEVESPVTISWEELTALPAREITTDIHCATRWSRFDASFKGVHWSELAKLVKPKPSARYVVAHAEQDYTANVPLAALEDEQALIAYEADGAPLTPDHGWPLRLVIPTRYFWKSAKWLRGIELLDHDEPGFWERLGYHNDADFWKEQRYWF